MKLTIKEMQYLAEKRDGKCLSKEYINALSKLQWKCKQGHIWWATPHSIKNQKTWCPYCADHILTIAELHQIAKIRGGKCLSDKYIDYNTKLKWQCKEGHVWEALPSSVKYRSWCPYCAGRNKTIEDMNKIAKSRGGKCLSKKYIHCESKLQWECDKGHTWWATYQSIRKHWCPHCACCARSTIEEMQEIAKSRGGKCLSKEYINDRHKLKWQCSEGHIWYSAPINIKNKGHWCPICSSGLKERICRSYFEIMFKKEFPMKSPNWLDNNWHIDGYCNILNLAFEYNGIQHYKPICFGEYSKEKAKMNLKNQQIRDKEKLKLCNKNNVTLIVIPYTVKRKDIQHFIIQECKKRNIDIPNKKIVDYRKLKKVYLNDKLNEMKLLAESRNGKCLSKIYINQNTKLQWLVGPR